MPNRSSGLTRAAGGARAGLSGAASGMAVAGQSLDPGRRCRVGSVHHHQRGRYRYAVMTAERNHRQAEGARR